MSAATLRFYDSLRPGLEAGTYTIKVDHAIADATDAPSPSATQELTVQGPRFTLDPAEIHGFYPPAHGAGPFAETFPHVVLETRTLPWERELDVQVKVGDKTHIRVPWLALLVLDAAELPVAPPPSPNGQPKTGPTGAKAMSVEQLLAADDPHVAAPAPVNPVSPEEKKLVCQALEIPTALFAAVAPAPAELDYLVHVRSVEVDDKSGEDAEDAGWYALVVASRTPAAGSTGVVHLVSLEGHESLLRGAETKPSVRLVSLASWSFTETSAADGKTPETTSFGAVASGLRQPRPGERGDLALGLPYDESKAGQKPPVTDPAGQVADRLARGYVPVRYHLPTGEDTLAWYRGPFAARRSAALGKKVRPFASSSAALVYDPATGLFDISLATAWEIGRALALADRKFATELVRFRRSVHRLVDLILAGLQSQHIDTSKGDLKEIAKSGLIEEQFLGHLKGGLAKSVATLSKAAPPPAESQGSTTEPQVTPIDAVKKLLEDKDLEDVIAAEVAGDLEPIAAWLAELTCLHLVPFAYLVPHPSLLPDESIRFFEVDGTWTGSLFDGALSVGVQSSRDNLAQRVARKIIAAAWRRDELARPAAGLLLRSALVAGWPGLTVEASMGARSLKPFVRTERLAPNVLLCLFDAVPDQVRLRAPHQGLHFAVERLAAKDRQWRDDTARVLDVGAVAATIKAPGAAQFALSMISFPDQLTFGRQT